MDSTNHLLPPEDTEDPGMVDDLIYKLACCDCDDSDENKTPRHQPSYAVLSEDDIRRRQEEDITAITSLLSISRTEAGLLLRHCNWSETKVHDQWFVDEERVRKAVGLLENPVVEFPGAEELTCGLCLKTFPKEEIYSAACGHPFCSACWAGYVSAAVNNGPSCLMLRCPDPTCDAAVGVDMVKVLASEDDSGKYAGYFLRSYIEDNMKVKRCPAAGCDYAVEFVDGTVSYDVTCRCSYSFCWNCTEEAHRPIDCGTAANWISTNAAVSELCNPVLADSKKCPKCKVLINKNQGSMHITCEPPCKFEFCWLCLDPWTKHDNRTDGYYPCQYDAAKQNGCYDMSNERLVEYSMERYIHYYERWAANQSSKQKAMEDLQLIQNVHLQNLGDIHYQSKSDLKFITEAWSQIVECRHVLQWTYAYGCQLPEHGHAKRQLFEYLQGKAEANLERLHHFAEKEMQMYLTAEMPSRDLNQFRTKLASLTRWSSVTRKYFESLEEVVALGCGSSSKVRSKTAKARTLVALEPRWEIDDFWACDRCTYANPFSASACLLCVEAMGED